jgi:hypothetical protein
MHDTEGVAIRGSDSVQSAFLVLDNYQLLLHLVVLLGLLLLVLLELEGGVSLDNVPFKILLLLVLLVLPLLHHGHVKLHHGGLHLIIGVRCKGM